MIQFSNYFKKEDVMIMPAEKIVGRQDLKNGEFDLERIPNLENRAEIEAIFTKLDRLQILFEQQEDEQLHTLTPAMKRDLQIKQHLCLKFKEMFIEVLNIEVTSSRTSFFKDRIVNVLGRVEFTFFLIKKRTKEEAFIYDFLGYLKENLKKDLYK